VKIVKATAALRALCRLQLPAEQLLPALLEALHGIVPSHRNLFDWTDERAHLVRYFFEGPIDSRIAQLYFDEFHNRRETDAMPPFRALESLPSGVRGAHELSNERFYGTALYHEIWKPQGMHTRIEAVLRGPGGHLLGSLVLYRAPGDPPFTLADEARLAQLLPDIARAVAACGPAVADEPHLPAPAAPETLLLTLGGEVCHASVGAHALLLLCDGGASRDRLSRPLSELAQGLLPLLLARLRLPVAPQHRPGSLNLVHPTVAGPLHASAALLAPQRPGAEPLVQVTLRRMEPQRLALERVLRALPLTAGQATVCRELYHGASQAEAAARLGVGAATVVDHVRKAYGALGLRSATELRALLDRRMLVGT
jgi:DNA-binding CsgD family transcriptional regulator